jgi:hypothetical protein
MGPSFTTNYFYLIGPITGGTHKSLVFTKTLQKTDKAFFLMRLNHLLAPSDIPLEVTLSPLFQNVK